MAGLDILATSKSESATMPLIPASAKSAVTTLLCVAGLLLSHSAVAASALKVGDQSGLVQALLKAAGEDQNLSYSLSWHPFMAGPPLLEALSAGAVDVGVVGNAPPIFAQAGGFALRIIGVANGAQNNNAVLVPEGSTAHSISDLKGKRVAVAKGSSGHYLLLAALRQAGLNTRDINVAYVSPVDGQNAFAADRLDAWAVWYPFVGQATARGGRVLLDGSAWAETGLNFTVASQQALDDPERSAQLGELLSRLARAQNWATAHPADWAKALAQTTRLPLPLVEEMLARQNLHYVPIDTSIMALQQRLADAFAAEQMIPKPLDVTAVFDDRFNAQLP
jgi:sulfonate transport system substrate-binding protein